VLRIGAGRPNSTAEVDMGSQRRWAFLGIVTAVGLGLAVPLVASGAQRAAGAVVITKGTEVFDINGAAMATFRFAPELISVPSGSTVTFKHLDSGRDPHTITIITNRRHLPHDFEGANCKACQAANAGHFPNRKPPVAVLNKGAPGLNQEGDSLLIRPKKGASVSAQVSAPPGTTLYYVCIIHPWMQGTIKVT
jgi:plastocyanin